MFTICLNHGINMLWGSQPTLCTWVEVIRRGEMLGCCSEVGNTKHQREHSGSQNYHQYQSIHQQGEVLIRYKRYVVSGSSVRRSGQLGRNRSCMYSQGWGDAQLKL